MENRDPKQILKSKSPFSDDEIENMSDNDAWAWIYAEQKKKNALKESSRLPEVCFTGFDVFERERLSDIAVSAGFSVKENVTKGLKILVTGENAGPSKIAKAETQGVTITNENGFMEYVQSLEK